MVLRKPESYPEAPTQTSSFKEWKWEKRHWLIVIALGCLALWGVGNKMVEGSWFKPVISSLPLIGSACFALETIIKLAQ